MKEKVKLIAMLFLIVGVIVSSFTSVNAHSVELDPNSLITFPNIIVNGEGKISIYSSETGYTLYYQAVELSNTAYDQIEELNENGQKEVEAIKTEVEALEAEYDNLKTIYKEAYEAYQEKIDNNITGAELEEAKTALRNRYNVDQRQNINQNIQNSGETANENLNTKMQESITKTLEERQKYLEGLASEATTDNTTTE